MSALKEAMRALSGSLAASLDKTGVVGHALTKGELREEDLRAALRPHLPGRFELTSGIVVNASGAQSKQQDVIIADSATVPPFIASGGLTVQPVEAVVATLEVKSSATAETVRDGVAKALSVAALLPDTKRKATEVTGGAVKFVSTAAKPFAGILALEARAARDALLQAFANAHPREALPNRCNAIVVPGEFCACWATAEGHLAPLAGADAPKLGATAPSVGGVRWFGRGSASDRSPSSSALFVARRTRVVLTVSRGFALL